MKITEDLIKLQDKLKKELEKMQFHKENCSPKLFERVCDKERELNQKLEELELLLDVANGKVYTVPVH